MMTNKHTALVTGGMGGLGEAVARKLHDAGHTVLVTHSPGNDHVKTWLAKQGEEGYSFHAYATDIADYDACEAMAANIRADGYQVDILINNAGVTRDTTFRKMSKIDWDTVLRTNLDSMFNVTKPFAESMAERGWGRIVNVASINGSKGQFGQTNYSASKAGIHGFTKSLAQELARKGVTVNTVSPGYLDTQMVAAVPKEILESKVISQIPVGRLGKPSELAALIAFVCSDDAAFMTGSNVSMNGGQHMY
ncbi:acetoacetyl-CoA reductase [Allopusillimonas ginsengisoli]|uniref:acetoacetyl-CoA reductase n=1 Tax=Allopusillimonas ginsengisoli TaxID=453575 RepID=UPI0010C24499|nr:acetoacetyl-CoA reductase [Allopusillimonas ginsengisoli]